MSLIDYYIGGCDTSSSDSHNSMLPPLEKRRHTGHLASSGERWLDKNVSTCRKKKKNTSASFGWQLSITLFL